MLQSGLFVLTAGDLLSAAALWCLWSIALGEQAAEFHAPEPVEPRAVRLVPVELQVGPLVRASSLRDALPGLV